MPFGQKTGPGHCPEQELIALPLLMIDQTWEPMPKGGFAASLIYVLIVSPRRPLSLRLLCRFPLVILQQAAQSFSTPHCSPVPSCLRLRRKQDPVVFALMVALLVVMYEILLQRSPQRRFSKQDQPRQTFFFDRPHPAFCVRVQIRASRWQSKRIHVSRFHRLPKRQTKFGVTIVQQVPATFQESPVF